MTSPAPSKALAEEIERQLQDGLATGVQTLTLKLSDWLLVRAALRAGQPEMDVGYMEYHDGLIGVFKMNPDGTKNLRILTPQASEQFRAMLAAASSGGKT